MEWISVACDLSVSVEVSIFLSVFKLMLLASVVSLPSTVSTYSRMVLGKSFFETSGEEAALLMASAICARTSRTGAYARRMVVGLGSIPSMLPLWGIKSTRRPRM